MECLLVRALRSLWRDQAASALAGRYRRTVSIDEFYRRSIVRPWGVPHSGRVHVSAFDVMKALSTALHSSA